MTPVGNQAPSPPSVTLPYIPFYFKPYKESVSADKIKYLHNLRGNRVLENVTFARGRRRADHELEMAKLELASAESRRKVAEKLLKKAKEGCLGIDFIEDEVVSTDAS